MTTLASLGQEGLLSLTAQRATCQRETHILPIGGGCL